MRRLETHYRDLCDIEFTIQQGTLWMLQTRVGKRTAAAAFRIAVQLVDEGHIDMDEALRRVTGAQQRCGQPPVLGQRGGDVLARRWGALRRWLRRGARGGACGRL